MDLEAPLDGWYVWFGVALMTVAIGGVAMSLPTEPPPDANEVANTIEEVSTSEYNSSATYEHDADEVKIDAKRIQLRSEEGGTARASLAFGIMTPVREHPDETERQKGINVSLGADPTQEFNNATEMAQWAETARQAADESGWHQAEDELRVRQIYWGDTSVTFVYI